MRGMQTMTFAAEFSPQWSDVDQNGHMRTTAYLASAEDMRMRYFAQQGFAMSTFARLGIGPVIQHNDLRYHAELRLLDTATLSLELAGLSEDGARFTLRNTYTRADGRTAATVTSTGGWLDLARRRLARPPHELNDVLQALDRTADYAELPALDTGT